MNRLQEENVTSLTTMSSDSMGFEAKYNYSDRLNKTEYHCHDFYEFYIHLRGGQHYALDDKLYILNPNQLYIIPPYSMHGLSSDHEMVGYERLYLNVSTEMMKHLSFDEFDLDLFFRSYTSRGQFVFQLTSEQAGQCTDLIRRLEERKLSGIVMENYSTYCMLSAFLNIICQSVLNSPSVTGNVISNNVIQDVLTFINNNYTKPIKMDALARQFGISVSYLSHEFVRYTNRSVYEYILYRRVVLARQMIQTDLSLNNIAYECGFNDYSNFLRAFSRQVGMSPSAYRKQLKPLQRLS